MSGVDLIRVGLVDDQHLVRRGIRSLLELSDEVVVVAEGEDGDDAVTIATSGDVDVLLLDLRMPGRDGLSALQELAGHTDPAPTLVLTTFDDDELVLGALRHGARGYLLKDVTLDQLLGALRVLVAGGNLWQPTVTERLLRAVRDRPAGVDGVDRPEPLTARELDVLRLVAAGYSNAEIGSALHLATGTVKNHVSSVLLKLGVRDRTRAVLRALDLGVLGDAGEGR